jgi:hypothetical protein
MGYARDGIAGKTFSKWKISIEEIVCIMPTY